MAAWGGAAMSAVVELPTADVLAEWDGLCLELVNSLLHAHPTGEVLWVEPRHGSRMWRRWKYHAALVLDGLVWDAWHPEVRLPPAEYVAAVFGAGTPWEMNPGVEGAR